MLFQTFMAFLWNTDILYNDGNQMTSDIHCTYLLCSAEERTLFFGWTISSH